MAVKLLLLFIFSQSWPVKQAINQYYEINEDKNLCFLFTEKQQLIGWEGDGQKGGGVPMGHSQMVPLHHLLDRPQELQVQLRLLFDLHSLHKASGAEGGPLIFTYHQLAWLCLTRGLNWDNNTVVCSVCGGQKWTSIDLEYSRILLLDTVCDDSKLTLRSEWDHSKWEESWTGCGELLETSCGEEIPYRIRPEQHC